MKWVPGWLMLLAVGAVPLSAQQAAVRKPTLAEDLQMFSQILQQIRLNHPDSVEAHDLIMAAIEGMLRAADPHSYAIPAARLSPETAQALISGKILPVLVAFRFLGGAPIVAAVAPGSSAARRDILRGDELVAMDGTREGAEPGGIGAGAGGAEAQRGDLDAPAPAERRVQGSRWNAPSGGKSRRTSPRCRPRSCWTRPRITTFASDRVDEDLAAALRTLEGSGMRRLVLDLRDNGGGSVQEATRVAGAFLPKGAVVYTAERRRAPKPDTVRVERGFWSGGQERRYPLVVLVNEGTAKASELVAGALQDHDRARIVGRPTFGKSLLMAPFLPTDGSLVMLVMGRVQTPCGRVVQREYRGRSTRDYWRLAGAESDTTGRPGCTTVGGRRVFGGGGIYPDLILPERDGPPRWLARLQEEDLPAKWAGG